MITAQRNASHEGFVDYVGLSTDTKPTTGVMNSTVFYEMDTKKKYMFDAENQIWREQ